VSCPFCRTEDFEPVRGDVRRCSLRGATFNGAQVAADLRADHEAETRRRRREARRRRHLNRIVTRAHLRRAFAIGAAP
jgi:hypothetical protein